MEYELACERLRDDIASVLLDMERPTLSATSLAAAATHDLADALHHAAGHPNDRRWDVALLSLDRFIDVCRRSPRALRSQSFVSLRAFLDENEQNQLPAKCA